MEVWVESVDVLDQRGYVFFNVHGGVAGYTRKPDGWHKGGSGGNPSIMSICQTNFSCAGSHW
nr:hypothetical protein [Pseudomonas lutea]